MPDDLSWLSDDLRAGAEDLPGGLSDHIWALPRGVVVRVTGREDAAREQAALQLLDGLDGRCPRALGLVDGPQRRAAPLTTLLPGTRGRLPLTREQLVCMAELAADLHAHEAASLQPIGARHGHFDASRFALAAQVAELVHHDRETRRCLVHHDLHPLNMVWSGAVAGLVDWPGAGLGDPAEDLGHLLLNLAVVADVEAAQVVLEHHERLAGPLATGSLLYAVGHWAEGWTTFIPVQARGMGTVETAHMAERVDALATWLVRRAG